MEADLDGRGMKTLEVGMDSGGDEVGVEVEGVAVLGAIDYQPGTGWVAGGLA